MELTPSVKKLYAEFQRWHAIQEAIEGASTIAVDEVAAKVASFYEKIRGVVDWREEHLLRKTAIERILSRRLFLHSEIEGFAEPFLQELIRGGHFPNGRLRIEKIDEVQNIVAKYVYILSHSSREGSEKFLAEVRLWLLGIAAAEIEETLAPPIRERALIHFMAEDMEKRFVVKNDKAMSDAELKTQISVAVQRALFKLDDLTIAYHLLEERYRDWASPSQETLEDASHRLQVLRQDIGNVLHNRLSERLYQLAEKYDTPYLLLGDIMLEKINEFERLAMDSGSMESSIKSAYAVRLKKLKAKMQRAAIYGTLSVFLSKILIALAIEIPVDRFLYGHFEVMNLYMSILIPSALMLVLVMSMKSTSRENLERVLMETMKISYGTRKDGAIVLRIGKKKRPALEAFINSVYLLSFLISYGALSWILWRFGFTPASIFVFLFFISLVASAGIKIRQRGREMILGEEKQGFLYTLFDLFALPIIQTGKWLSRQVARYNILIVIFNFLIEIPFQMFIEFLEQWRTFLREKREEVH